MTIDPSTAKHSRDCLVEPTSSTPSSSSSSSSPPSSSLPAAAICVAKKQKSFSGPFSVHSLIASYCALLDTITLSKACKSLNQDSHHFTVWTDYLSVKHCIMTPDLAGHNLSQKVRFMKTLSNLLILLQRSTIYVKVKFPTTSIRLKTLTTLLDIYKFIQKNTVTTFLQHLSNNTFIVRRYSFPAVTALTPEQRRAGSLEFIGELFLAGIAPAEDLLPEYIPHVTAGQLHLILRALKTVPTEVTLKKIALMYIPRDIYKILTNTLPQLPPKPLADRIGISPGALAALLPNRFYNKDTLVDVLNLESCYDHLTQDTLFKMVEFNNTQNWTFPANFLQQTTKEIGLDSTFDSVETWTGLLARGMPQPTPYQLGEFLIGCEGLLSEESPSFEIYGYFKSIGILPTIETLKCVLEKNTQSRVFCLSVLSKEPIHIKPTQEMYESFEKLHAIPPEEAKEEKKEATADQETPEAEAISATAVTLVKRRDHLNCLDLLRLMMRDREG